MIRGLIHDNRPLILICVSWQLGTQDHVVLIDTGFSGELKISSENAKELGLSITHTESIVLGDENIYDMPASVAYVVLEGVKSLVTVLLAPGETVIGVGLMRRFGYALQADFPHQKLMLERVV